MPRGFFPESQLLVSKQPISRIPKCGACGLHKTCISPKMPVSGKGRRKILVVAEAPGQHEDEQGIQLVGESGQLLLKALRKFDVDMRTDCHLTNAIICRPPKNIKPTDEEVGFCHPNLLNTLDALKPEVIITLGEIGVKSTLRSLWNEPIKAVGPWVGWQIPCQDWNAWICPTYHPSYVLRSKKQDRELLESYFERHLQAAAELSSRPWSTVPDYKAKVENILDPRQAAKIIREFIKAGGPCAFDYETNMLKPDSEHAMIVSCSICWRGKRTIAYPWLGEAIKATEEFIKGDNPKISGNMKFEERWTYREFGCPVNNWLYCTVNGAHVLDNRPNITSVKFQSFVRFGFAPYNDHIKSLLESKKGQKINRVIKEIDINQLLKYNGLDSLLEYKIGKQQRKELGYGDL